MCIRDSPQPVRDYLALCRWSVCGSLLHAVPEKLFRRLSLLSLIHILQSNVAPEYVDAMRRLERRTHLRKSILTGMYWGRLYGGAAGIIMVRGQDDLSQPLDLDLVLPGAFLGLQILDRWSGIYPELGLVTDPADPDFGLPEYYTIRDEDSGTLVSMVHHSHVSYTHLDVYKRQDFSNSFP